MLTVSPDVREALVEHAREGRPAEVCGILAGSDGDTARVERAIRTENVADAPRVEYEIDPSEQLAVMDRIDEDGQEVVGFYHSHPDGPDGPSATDAARASWPGYVYVVVSLADGPSVGAWRWDGERFVEERVREE